MTKCPKCGRDSIVSNKYAVLSPYIDRAEPRDTGTIYYLKGGEVVGVEGKCDSCDIDFFMEAIRSWGVLPAISPPARKGIPLRMLDKPQLMGVDWGVGNAAPNPLNLSITFKGKPWTREALVICAYMRSAGATEVIVDPGMLIPPAGLLITQLPNGGLKVVMTP